MKKNIVEAKRSNVKDLFVKDITEVLHPIGTLPSKRFPIVSETNPGQFKILSFAIFMQEIKTLSTGGKIPFKIFKDYIQKRKKSKWLDEEYLKLELDIMQQYLVTDDYCSYKEVALAMLLWNTKIIDEDTIGEYQKELAGSMEGSGEESYQYIKEEISFDQFKLIPGITSDREEERILKTFVFEIFKEEYRDKMVVKDYIETLKTFVQLQVFRYGDTLMILHEYKSWSGKFINISNELSKIRWVLSDYMQGSWRDITIRQFILWLPIEKNWLLLLKFSRGQDGISPKLQ